MLFLLAILFGLTTLGLVIAISFPMERRVSRMAKGTKRAMDRLDEAKGELWKARAKKDKVFYDEVLLNSIVLLGRKPVIA